MSLTDALLGKKKPASGPAKGPSGPKGPRKGPKASPKPNQTAEATRRRTKKTLSNGPGKGPNKPPRKPTGGGKKPAPKVPETTPSVNKGLGCFMNQIRNNPILRKQFSDLTIAIKIIETFLREDSNPTTLEVMGIERKEIVVLLQGVLGEYNDAFKKETTIERIGDFLRKAGHPGKFLFEEVFKLTENHDEGAIAAALNGFDQLVSQKKFFNVSNAVLNSYRDVLKAIEEKGATDPKEREIIARNILGIYRGYSPKLDLSDETTPAPPTQPASPAAPPSTPSAGTGPTAPAPTPILLSVEDNARIKAEAQAKIQAEVKARHEAEEKVRKEMEARRERREKAEAENRARAEAEAIKKQAALDETKREAEEKARKAAEEQTAEPEPITEPTPEIDEAEVETLKGALEITAMEASKVLDLYDLCEALSQIDESSLLSEKLIHSGENGLFFKWFVAMSDAFDPEKINDHLIRVLMSMGKNLSEDSVVDDLEALYDAVYPEYAQAKKQVEANEELKLVAEAHGQGKAKAIEQLDAEAETTRQEEEDDPFAQVNEALAEAEAIKKQAEEAEKARIEAEETARQEAIEQARKEAEDAERARLEAEETARKQAEETERARIEAEETARQEAIEQARQEAEAEERAKAEAKVAEAAGIISVTGGPQVVSTPIAPPFAAQKAPTNFAPATVPQNPITTPASPSSEIPISVPTPPARPPKPLTKAEKMLADMAEAIDNSNIKCAYLLDLAYTLIQVKNESLRDRLLTLNHPFVERFLSKNYKINDSNFMNHLMVAVNKSAKRGKFVNAETINQHLSDIHDELSPLLESFQEEIKKEAQSEEAEMASDEDVVELDPDEVELDPETADTVVGD